MTHRYAIIDKSGAVLNVALFRDKPPKDWGGVPEGGSLVALGNVKAGPGWKHEGGRKFVEPPEPPEPRAADDSPASAPRGKKATRKG